MPIVDILRDYQLAIYNEIPRRLREAQSVLVQSPARSGKSKIIAATCERITAAGKVAFVLTHRGKIQSQLVEHCSAVSITAQTDFCHIQPGHTYVAMNQTLIKRLHILEQLATMGRGVVLIIDEAHRGDFNKTFVAIPDALRIGFTATPAWKWAKHLPKNYSNLIHGPQVSALIKSDNIVPIDYYEMRSVDLSGLVKSNTGEYTEASNEFTFDRPAVYDGLFDELPRFEFNKCIIFTASKKSADRLLQQFIDRSLPATVYYSGLHNASYELARFTELGQCKYLITVSALSEGFDHPAIDFNVLWRATGSLPLYIQMGMRGATPNDGKAVTTVLDFGGNNSRFGGAVNINSLTMDRDWHALWQPPPERQRTSAGVAAIKECPSCSFLINASAMSCCNCGYIYPEHEVALKNGELVKIEHNLEVARAAVAQLKGRRISTLTAAELATWVKQRDKKAFGMRIAKSQSITNNQFAVDYGREMGYSPKWADRILEEHATILQHEPEYKIPFSDILVT